MSKTADADIYADIKQAMPIAKRVLREGLDDTLGELSERIPAPFPTGLTETQVEQVRTWAEAYYVVGVAVGLLLRSDTVLTDYPERYRWTCDEPRIKGGGR